jgi:Ca2+-binding RTX toxin-like protein
MSSGFDSIVGRPAYFWEEIMLKALKDGVLQETTPTTDTLTLVASDGATVILKGAFAVNSPTDVTGTLNSFEVWMGNTKVATAGISGGVEIESIPGVGQSDPIVTDLLEALQVMFINNVLATGSADGELLAGGMDNDTLNGNDGDDWLVGFAGNDTLDGGNGWDDVRYHLEFGTNNVIVNLSGSDKVVGAETIAAGTARDTYDNTDTLSGIDFISGSIHDDYFFGADTAGGYPQFVSGMRGDDHFSGGAAAGALGVAYDVAGLEGGLGVVINLTSAKAKHLGAGTGKDTYGDIDHFTNITLISGSGNKDVILGGAAGETFRGRDGADLLEGNKGKDRLEGDGGKDTLDGGKGKDSLSGGEGRDTLTGGADKDRFEFSSSAESKASASKRDYITDFKHGTDKIDLALVDANDIKGNNQTFKYDGEDTSAGKGHLAWYQVDKVGSADDRTIIVMNTDNDAKFEMSIELKGLIDLTKGDFIL